MEDSVDVKYEYIKGKGWQPFYGEYCKSISVTINNYKVTLYDRLPRLGELGWNYYSSLPFERQFENLHRWWNGDSAALGWECDQKELDAIQEILKIGQYATWRALVVERV